MQQWLSEKDEQLQASLEESTGLKALLQGMEAELQALKAEHRRLRLRPQGETLWLASDGSSIQ